MKIYAYIDEQKNIVGISSIYQTSGDFTVGMKEFIAQSKKSVDEALLDYARLTMPLIDRTLEDGSVISEPANYDVVIMDTSDLPSGKGLKYDSSFRWALKYQNKKVVVDLPKAREIHLTRLRGKRNKQLQELDIETMKNISNPTKLAEIEKQKQTLRDLPQALQAQLENCKTTEEIKKVSF